MLLAKVMPNPKLQFIVEVDGSDVGVRAVLSQCWGSCQSVQFHSVVLLTAPGCSYHPALSLRFQDSHLELRKGGPVCASKGPGS